MLEFIVSGGAEEFEWNPFFGPTVSTLWLLGAKWTPCIQQGQLWRLVAAQFLHAGVAHYLMNMMLQVVVGWQLERAFGW